MISSNSQKVLFIVFIALLLTASCKFWQSDSGNTNAPNSESEIQTNIPFSTKEPEVFQAQIIVTSFANGNKIKQKYFIAKNGEKFFQKFDVDGENERSILQINDSKTFVINNKSKSFREIPKENSAIFSDNSLIKSLTSKWLNEKNSASFEKLENENNLSKYSVKLNNTKNSEILIFIDEKLQMPVKQEFYSVANEKKTLTYSLELKNFKLQTDDKLFELPKDYKEIS